MFTVLRFTCARAKNVYGWYVFFLAASSSSSSSHYYADVFFLSFFIALLCSFGLVFSTSLNAIKLWLQLTILLRVSGYLLVIWLVLLLVAIANAAAAADFFLSTSTFFFLPCVEQNFILFTFLWLCTFHFTSSLCKIAISFRYTSFSLIIFIYQCVCSSIWVFFFSCFGICMCIRWNEFRV